MYSVKKYIILVGICLTILLFASLVYAERNVEGKTFYTLANIWYEKPNKIYSTNYHKGAIIEVGTKVTIKEVSADEIRFVDEKGRDYTIIFVQKHHPDTTIWDYFDNYFSEKNPMAEGGAFQKFTAGEKENIKAGVIKEGMSRDAVLMAYGYPPGAKTPSLKSDYWIYMENRFITRGVKFKDNKASDVRH